MSQTSPYFLLFDVDGTLSDSLANSFKGVCEVFRQSKLPLPSQEEYDEHFYAPFDSFYRRRGVTVSKAQIAEWYHPVAKHPEAKLFPDVLPTLQYIHRNQPQCRLGVLSAQHLTTIRIQLGEAAHYFQIIIGDREDKQSQLIDLRSIHGFSPENIYYVGDFCSDMYAARGADVQGVGITRGRPTAEYLKKAGAHHVIENLQELIDLLRL